MKIKKQYEMNETVWIHIGGPKLTKGKIIDIFDLVHAGYSKDMEFYLVEIQTSIDPILEVRTWSMISQDAKGPIGAFRQIKEEVELKKFLGKVGIDLPTVTQEVTDPSDPTPEQINAAIERAEKAKEEMYRAPSPAKPKRYYKKRPAKQSN